MLKFASGLNIEVYYFDGSERGKQGVSEDKKIGLLKGKTPLGYASVMCHEIAHEILHQQNEELTEEQKEKRKHKTREIIELEAEAVAYVVLKNFGIESTASPNYLACWKTNKERLRECFEDISFCATNIIEGVLEQKESPQAVLQEEGVCQV